MTHNSDHTLMMFATVLKEIKNLMHGLLESEDNKYDALRSIDIYKLIKSNEIQEELLSSFEILEKVRQDHVETLSLMLGFDASLSLSEFAAKIPQPQADILLSESEQIRILAERISIATERNSYILNNNAEIIAQILEIAGGNLGQHYDRYGSAAAETPIPLYVLDQTI
ncbi:FlgN protein [Brevinema andersonii]|uniref:FlgN protein n=1 Tax=Brevinema andersonii TaxID=34097 RepID=A0A1I1DA92_BREAD|nr:flagellar export chaperone FlgN [Brevinema andersonii]SFB71246.1 FlgN protein [Brevinema andersonii]